jgi:biofilm PGA synthesis N-glycosyltransferase PgaC
VTWAILQRGFFVGYAEDAVCFTHAPESLGTLVRQRVRWARGMIEAFHHHPEILLQRRLTTFLVGWNLLYPWMDFAFTFGFIPGLVLAACGHYWLVGPLTLALIPSAVLMGAVMYRMSARVFTHQGLRIRRDLPALIGYTLAYGLINHPASLSGYFAELFGMRKTWGTK